MSDYLNEGQFVKAEEAYFVQSEEIHSPMGGHTIAFSNPEIAKEFATKYNTQVSTWDQFKP
jgi:nitrous oxide reductase accessory protein NosL